MHFFHYTHYGNAWFEKMWGWFFRWHRFRAVPSVRCQCKQLSCRCEFAMAPVQKKHHSRWLLQQSAILQTELIKRATASSTRFAMGLFSESWSSNTRHDDHTSKCAECLIKLSDAMKHMPIKLSDAMKRMQTRGTYAASVHHRHLALSPVGVSKTHQHLVQAQHLPFGSLVALLGGINGPLSDVIVLGCACKAFACKHCIRNWAREILCWTSYIRLRGHAHFLNRPPTTISHKNKLKRTDADCDCLERPGALSAEFAQNINDPTWPHLATWTR